MPVKKQVKKTTTQKVNKDEKPLNPSPVVICEEEYRCSCCGHKYKRQRGNFNISKSQLYAGNNGYMTICKTCIQEIYEQFVKFYNGNEDSAIERICQITDMYFDESSWEASRKSTNGRSRISAYISNLNIGGTNKKTYSDNIIKRWEEGEEEKPDYPENVVSQEVIRRFGAGFTDDEYDSLEYEYQDWVKRYGAPIDKHQEELYVSICYMKLNFQKGIQSGTNNAGTSANSYKALIEAATTEIEDRKRKEEERTDLTPLGIMIRDMENYAPAEFFKDKKRHQDDDGTKSYIDRFMLRPLKNLLTGSKDLDKEFSLTTTETEP